MLDAPGLGDGFAGLRHGLSAGEALPEAVRAAWTAATGKPIHEALGMSEISTYVSFVARPAARRRARPASRSRAGASRSCREDGDAPVPRGERRAARGLAPRPGADARLLAAARGDRRGLPRRVVRDRRPGADGARTAAIAHLGRADDVMNAGGYRVSPAEVEAALARAPRRRRGRGGRARGPRPASSSSPPSTCRAARRCAEAELAAHCAGAARALQVPAGLPRRRGAAARAPTASCSPRRLKEAAAP